ncbi:replicative DNA helicase [Christensenellaceae bacterium OttesenSCG-928-M15]|nr:replicative DNA helicase [Christensenellaceae bacterium OttesenSCG-928-M15]
MEHPPYFPDEHSEAIAPQSAPHSRQSEICVLGSMLLDPGALDLSIEQLEPEDFYIPAHQDIFSCMRDLRNHSAPVDSVSLIAELDRLGKLRAVGDVPYIAELTIQTPSASNIEYYILVVTECSMQRQLIIAGNAIARDAMDSSRDLEDMLNDAERRIYDITLKRSTDTLMHVAPTMNEVFSKLGEMRKNRGDLQGVPTGFYDLDQKTSGLKKSDLIIVAGRPAMGKTSLAINMAQHASLHAGYSVVVFSLEMSREQLVLRMFSTDAEIDLYKLLNGNHSEEDHMKIADEVLDRMGQSRLYIDDSAGATVPEIRSKCRRLKAREGLDLIVIDYLQLMRSPRKTDNRQQEISEITRSLKILARELDVPIILLSQLSRAPEQRRDDQGGHRPMISDLRESGSIEQDADIVMLLYRDQVYNEDADNVAEVIIAKHRNGSTGTVKLGWFGEYTKFKNLANQH